MPNPEEIKVCLYDFQNRIAILDAINRPVMIYLASWIPEERRHKLEKTLKETWQALSGEDENQLMLVTIVDKKNEFWGIVEEVTGEDLYIL
jgi:hypothetical protein